MNVELMTKHYFLIVLYAENEVHTRAYIDINAHSLKKNWIEIPNVGGRG